MQNIPKTPKKRQYSVQQNVEKSDLTCQKFH